MIAGIPRGFKNPRKESVNEKNDKQPSGTKKIIWLGTEVESSQILNTLKSLNKKLNHLDHIK